MDTPQIYVACLASYNNGTLHGEWISATQSESDIMAEIYDMLANSPKEDAEEFAIHDFEGFGNADISEYTSIKTIADYGNFINEHGHVGAALLSEYEASEAESMMDDCYQGSFDSEVDFAWQLFDECYAHQIPEHLRYYFDCEAFARDLFINDYCSVDVNGETHVFSRY
ncbi:antirestriction protein ArdA [Legionella israelensis]|uniref:Antirestriction protein n=1 Tax=Legionella israelensis TaxID=454 RepID=A0A0W0V1F7_9GAMM|nr:antirestriction protein ArdA [Legionella israelensis]KTD13968.1 antirestriction protein [Legionella israelensis]QBS09627.1 antirestriction protein ArdA [Legionella israelensis]SCY36973.1 Antirestriction protein [Legionella israelensis DSM 19235]STX60558.1 antirestriction protein [Legionella israelensis]